MVWVERTAPIDVSVVTLTLTLSTLITLLSYVALVLLMVSSPPIPRVSVLAFMPFSNYDLQVCDIA